MRLLDATLVAYVVHGASVFEPSGIAAWCRTNKISRATLCRHLARIRQEGAWRPRSRAPRRRPGATPPVIVEAILALRASLAPENGPVTIHYHLGRLPDLAGYRLPCPATIHRILRRHGLVEPALKKRPESSWRRFAYARPRGCYQIDACMANPGSLAVSWARALGWGVMGAGLREQVLAQSSWKTCQRSPSRWRQAASTLAICSADAGSP